jgi:hypothetical protein
MSARELPTYVEAPEPLTDRERALLARMFSDYFEVPGEWKTALKSDLERDPPILGKQTLGPGGALGPNSVTTLHIADGTITDVDVNALNKDGTQATPSLRTLGTGHLQAAAGDDPRFIAATGDKNYIHNQVAVSANWSVLHNLGKYPSVFVVDTGNSVILPDVIYVDTNTLALSFAAATSGKAYIN